MTTVAQRYIALKKEREEEQERRKAAEPSPPDRPTHEELHAEAEAKQRALIEQDRTILRQSGVRGKLEELKTVLPKGAEIVEVEGREVGLELRWDHGKREGTTDEEIKYRSVGVEVAQGQSGGLRVMAGLEGRLITSTEELTEALVEAALKPGIVCKHRDKPKEHGGHPQPEGYRGGYV